MIKPFRAQYGERDNSHVLLAWDKINGELPTSLLGLTDKPQFSTSPGEVWWPSVGCCPIEQWWALWWTTPDEKAKRSGMAKSEVAIWRIEDIGKVDDLSPYLEELCGAGQIVSPPTSLLNNTTEALLSGSPKQPVIKDLELWPGLLAALWKQLWPNARKQFSACVAGQPPQGGEWQANPILFGTPSTRALHWSNYPVFDGNTTIKKIGRGAQWLSGVRDDTLDEIIQTCPEISPELKNINRFSRAAGHLEKCRDNNSPDSALGFLRTIVTLAPEKSQAASLKQEALEIVRDHIQEASAGFVSSLANLDNKQIPADEFLANEISSWTKNALPTSQPDSATQLISFLKPKGPKNWWQNTVQSALASELTHLSSTWALATFQWIAQGASQEIIQSLLSASPENEEKFLAVAEQHLCSSITLIQKFSKRMRWSRLHAWAAGAGSSPNVAFEAQRNFPINPMEGLVYLLKSLPGKAALTEYLSHPESTPVEVVAQRTVNDSSLLTSLDATVDPWRRLWAEHIHLGGPAWPDSINADTAKMNLLNAVLRGGATYGLVKALAEDLSETALTFPQIDEVLSIIPMNEQAALAKKIAQKLINEVNAGHQLSNPGQNVLREVYNTLTSITPSGQLIACLFEWDANIEEETARAWLTRLPGEEIAAIGDLLGNRINELAWKNIAQDIFKRSFREHSLKTLANDCNDLLPNISKLRLRFSNMLGAPISKAEKNQLLIEIARLGADTTTEGLHDLWERAGGKRKHLKLNGTPESQWQHAVICAEAGKLEGGVGALLNALEIENPHNPDIKDLKKMWRSIDHKRIFF